MTNSNKSGSGVIRETSARVSDIYDLSNLTKNEILFWLQQRLLPESPLYNMAFAFRISGAVDIRHFQSSFQALIDCSDALRTVFEEIDGIPQQRVLQEFPYNTEYVDFSKTARPETQWNAWVLKRSVAHLDYSKCLFDSVLVKLAQHEFIWYLNIHHLVVDSWATSLVFRRMSALYRLSLEGKLDSHRPSFPQFEEYVAEEKEYRSSPLYLADHKYWQGKLAQRMEPIRLYGSLYSRDMIRQHRLKCDLGIERSNQLRVIARRKDIAAVTQDLSLFNIFGALLTAYLYRITGNRKLSIGIPFHNRPSKRHKDIIGLLMEVAPLHTEISERETFVSLIRKVMIETYATISHVRYAPGNPHNTPAFEVLLDYHLAIFPEFNGFPVETEWLHTGFADGSLSLHVHDFGESGNLVLEYLLAEGIFDRELGERAAGHFLRIVDKFLEDPDCRIDDFSLLSANEKTLLLDQFGPGIARPLSNQAVTCMIEHQSKINPQNAAIIAEDQVLSYKELDEKANQLANYLLKLGAGPEVIVGVCMERSSDLIIALLGILKAGGAYLPLDSMYPAERIDFMLRDAAPKILLTQSRLMGKLPMGGWRMICLDKERLQLSRESIGNPEIPIKPDSLAYLIYTSGSTGLPKGVQVEHRGLPNLVLEQIDLFDIKPESRVLQFASLNFDASVSEIFVTLAAGATLVICRDSDLLPGENLLRTLRDYEISVVTLPPSVLSQMEPEDLSELKTVVSAGEACGTQTAARWASGRNFINAYGPTEATVCVSAAEYCNSAGAVSIGRPIANTRVYILDSSLQLVPLGAVGELCVSGQGLARGYRNRPELTREKFVQNSLDSKSRSLLYRTGDLARFLPNGNLEYIGRMDSQVKVRGFRIELGEVESVLNRHPDVEVSAAVVREDVPGDKRLVAYAVLKRKSAVSVSALRAHLAKSLPGYMVPSSIVFLESFPLNPHGKIDRRALPTPEQIRPDLGLEFKAPKSEVECAIASVWQKELRLTSVGLHDNFFDIGGHSLLLVRIHAKLQQVLQREIAVVELFRYPTIASLARYLENDNIAVSSFDAVQQRGRMQRNAVRRRKPAITRRTDR